MGTESLFGKTRTSIFVVLTIKIFAEINEILAAEFCSELLAPVYAAYEAEKKQILE